MSVADFSSTAAAATSNNLLLTGNYFWTPQYGTSNGTSYLHECGNDEYIFDAQVSGSSQAAGVADINVGCSNIDGTIRYYMNDIVGSIGAATDCASGLICADLTRWMADIQPKDANGNPMGLNAASVYFTSERFGYLTLEGVEFPPYYNYVDSALSTPYTYSNQIGPYTTTYEKFDLVAPTGYRLCGLKATTDLAINSISLKFCQEIGAALYIPPESQSSAMSSAISSAQSSAVSSAQSSAVSSAQSSAMSSAVSSPQSSALSSAVSSAMSSAQSSAMSSAISSSPSIMSSTGCNFLSNVSPGLVKEINQLPPKIQRKLDAVLLKLEGLRENRLKKQKATSSRALLTHKQAHSIINDILRL